MPLREFIFSFSSYFSRIHFAEVAIFSRRKTIYAHTRELRIESQRFCFFGCDFHYAMSFVGRHGAKALHRAGCHQPSAYHAHQRRFTRKRQTRARGCFGHRNFSMLLLGYIEMPYVYQISIIGIRSLRAERRIYGQIKHTFRSIARHAHAGQVLLPRIQKSIQQNIRGHDIFLLHHSRADHDIFFAEVQNAGRRRCWRTWRDTPGRDRVAEVMWALHRIQAAADALRNHVVSSGGSTPVEVPFPKVILCDGRRRNITYRRFHHAMTSEYQFYATPHRRRRQGGALGYFTFFMP